MTAHRVLTDIYSAEHVRLDPGNGGALKTQQFGSGLYQLQTAAAETRVLNAPLRSGIELSIVLAFDGGNCVVTSAVAINTAGNTIMTFADARAMVVLRSIESNGVFYWSVISNDAVALS